MLLTYHGVNDNVIQEASKKKNQIYVRVGSSSTDLLISLVFPEDSEQ